jgi:hypothetical protein
LTSAVVEGEGARVVGDAVPLVLVLAEGEEVDVELDEVDEVEVDEAANEPLLHAASAKPATKIAAMEDDRANFVDSPPFLARPGLWYFGKSAIA